MVLAMAAFAVEDMLIKAASQSVPLGLVLALFSLGGLLIFIWLAKRQGDAILHPTITSRAILLRACCEVTGRLSLTKILTP